MCQCRRPVVIVIARKGEHLKARQSASGQLEGAEIPQASDDENVSKKRLYLEFRTGRGAPNPLLDSNLELGRIDS